MNKIIKTESGSTYILSEKDGRTFLMKGLLCGEVVKFYEEVNVGGTLRLDFIKDGLYGKPESFPTYLHSSTITEIVNL